MSLLAPWDFYFRAFRSPGSPRAPAGYHYEAKLRIASADFHPQAPQLVSLHPDSQTFRTFTAVLSSIAAFTTPEAPVRAPQFFRTGTGHRVIRRPLAAPITPQISFMREVFSTLNPFTLVTALLFARPTGLTRPAGLCVPAGPLGLLLPGFQVARVTPCSCRISLRG